MLDRPGFADPATESQACFRALLDAMSRPGTLHRVGEALLPPPPLDPATAAVLLTLVDADTPFWLDERGLDARSGAVREWVAFHCGAVAGAADACRFALSLGEVALGGLHAGTDLAPEESATLILQLPGLGDGSRPGEGTAHRLSGPGLREASVLRATGLPRDFVAQWAANHALYPRGVDLVLCAGERLCALPRSLSVEAMPAIGEG